MGFDRTIIAVVAGIRIIAAYLTEDANTIWRSLISFFGLIFEKAGNSTVDTGIVKNVSIVANWIAAW